MKKNIFVLTAIMLVSLLVIPTIILASNKSDSVGTGNQQPQQIKAELYDGEDGEVPGNGEQNKEQIQTINQGEAQQLMNQNQNQNEGAQTSGSDDKGEGNMEQNQNQEQNFNSEDYKSVVANFVQSLIKVADRQQNGIGEQVREIAQEQNQSKEKVAESIEAVQSRSKIRAFFFGTDFKNIGQLRSEMTITENNLEQLDQVMDQISNQIDKTEIQNQIQELTQERERINQFVEDNEKQFSLLGWFVKLFAK